MVYPAHQQIEGLAHEVTFGDAALRRGVLQEPLVAIVEDDLLARHMCNVTHTVQAERVQLAGWASTVMAAMTSASAPYPICAARLGVVRSAITAWIA